MVVIVVDFLVELSMKLVLNHCEPEIGWLKSNWKIMVIGVDKDKTYQVDVAESYSYRKKPLILP